MIKTANPTSVPEPGADVTFTVQITAFSNPGDPITIYTLVDDIHGNLDGQGTCNVPVTIQPSGSYTCSFTAFVGGAEGDSETDTATATGTDVNGVPVSDSDDATVVITGFPPVIDVVKTANPTSVPEPGGDVEFTVVVTNNSGPTDPVTIDSLVDDIHGNLDGQGTCNVPVTIPPGGSYTCTFTAFVGGNAGDSETDTVTASGTDDEGTPVSDSDDATVVITGFPPVIDVVKTANPTSVPEPGGDVEFTVVVTNNSGPTDPVTIDSLVDDIHGNLDGQGTCNVPVTIPPGGSYTCTFTAFVGGNAGDSETDTVTASGADDEGTPVSDSDDATVVITGFPPVIDVVKTANPTSVPEPGGDVEFTVVVTNNSGPTDPVTIDSLVDDIHGNLDGQGTCNVPVTIPPGGSYTCTFTAFVGGNAGDSETDTVIASGTDDEGTPVSDSDDATVVITGFPPVIDVVKTANPTSVPEPGGDVEFTVVVTNNSGPTDPVTIDSLVDDIHGNLDGQGTCNVPVTIPPGGSYTCTFTAFVGGNAGDSETDTVTASGADDEGTPVSDFDDATVEIVAPPLPVIDVVKTADPSVVEEPGGDVTFTVVVTNNSGPDTPVTITSLVDSIHGDLNGQGTCSVPQTIQPGDSYTCEFTAPVEGAAGDSETDVVTASGHDENDNPVEDSDDATVVIVPADGLPVIDVQKDADPTRLPEPGGMVTFTVVVTNNSSPADPVTITSLVDDIHGDLNGQGTCSVPQTIQPGESYTCQFTALVEGSNGDSETDTVTASGTDDEGNPVEDSDDATVVIGYYKIYLPNAENQLVIDSLVPMTIGFEDLDINRDDMDYDYNDWVTVIDTRLQVDPSTNNLYRINFTFIPQARGGVRSHIPHIKIPANAFASDGVATITVKDNNGNVVSSEQVDFVASQDNDFTLMDCTCDAFPQAGQVVNAFEEQPYEPTQRTSELSIQFDIPGPFNQDYLTPEQISIPHGEGLFFDPYIVVIDRNLEIHQGDSRLLSVPEIIWDWPEERVRLDEVYPLVTGDPPNFTFGDQWWTNHNTCVYGDGVKCPTSPDFSSYVPEE